MGNAGKESGCVCHWKRLRPFRNHPFKVKADLQMLQLIESISKCGILNPLIVRPVPEGVYEIIFGHRRKYAAQQLGFQSYVNPGISIPAEVCAINHITNDYTKVEITKSDITDGKPVIGAKLTIFDKDGKEVESWVSNPTTPTTSTETPKETPTTPKTGDDQNLLIWLLLLGIGGSLAGAAWYLRKKDKEEPSQG